MTPQNIPTYRPLTEWPELIEAFASDLSACNTHADAQALLAGLSHQEKQIIFAACPQQLQRRLWRLRKGATAA